MINYNAVCMFSNLTLGDTEDCRALIEQIVSPDEPHHPITLKLNFLISQKYLSSPGATDVIGQNHLNAILKLYENLMESKVAAQSFVDAGGW